LASVQFSASTYNVTEECAAVVLTVSRTGDLSGPATVDFLTSDGSANQRTDYTISSGTVKFASGESSKAFQLLITEDHYVEGAEQFSVALSSSTGATLGNPNVATVTIDDDDVTGVPAPAPKLFVAILNGAQEVPSTNSTAKGIGVVQLNANETSAAVSVSFTGFSSTQTLAHIHGPAAAGTNAPILFPLPNGAFNDFQVSPTAAQVQQLKDGLFYLNIHSQNFPDGEIRGQLLFNAIDDVHTFVGQHYHDLLAREADSAGINYWEQQLTNCGANALCISGRRTAVSDAFFFEPEYQDSAAWLYRLYVMLIPSGQHPAYTLFMPDRSRLMGGPNLGMKKPEFLNLFVSRSAFLTEYPLSMTAAEYVDKLNSRTGNSLTQSERDTLVNGLNGATETRATVLGKVADNSAFIDHEYNNSFVLNLYFDYLRRDAEPGGFDFWLMQINSAPLRNVAKQQSLVCSFITANEYSDRFGSVRTHSNQECAP
jgi:hypothetical protein